MADPFATLGLPASFAVNPAEVEEAYFTAQRQWHPDRFVGQAAPERMAAAQASADANEAYRILLDPLDRARYLLARENLHVAGDQDNVRPTQELLGEMLDRREQLAAATDADFLMAIEVRARGDISACLDALDVAFAEARYEDAAHLTLRLKYLRALEEEVARHPAWNVLPGLPGELF